MLQTEVINHKKGTCCDSIVAAQGFSFPDCPTGWHRLQRAIWRLVKPVLLVQGMWRICRWIPYNRAQMIESCAEYRGTDGGAYLGSWHCSSAPSIQAAKPDEASLSFPCFWKAFCIRLELHLSREGFWSRNSTCSTNPNYLPQSL